LKTSDFLSFALIISSDESQSETQFNVGTGYRAENTVFFSTDENFKKSSYLFTLFFSLVIMYKILEVLLKDIAYRMESFPSEEPDSKLLQSI